MNDYLLFDLDGTLTDPKQGITKCVQYALEHFGIEEPDLDKLEPFIGPPLTDSFMEFYGFDEAKAAEAVEKYRERFKDTGIFENEIYPGVPDMLRKLKGNGKKLAITSSKPTVFVERILEHFEIRRYFDVVVGSELDGTRVEKKEVIEEALRQLLGDREIKHDEVVIIGDRKFDIEGGQAHDITTVAVSYGYGPMEELKEAKADYIVRSVGELEKLLLRGTEVAKSDPASGKVWYLLFPVLMAFFIWQIGSNLGMYLTITLANTTPALAPYLVEFNEEGAPFAMTGNGLAVMSIIAFGISGFIYFRMGKNDRKQAAALAALKGKKSPVIYAYAAVATIGMALGLNLLFNLVGLTNTTEAFEQLQKSQNSASFPLAVLTYCMLAPWAEELVFRGIFYNRLKKSLKPIGAMVCASLLFGLYHGNMITGGYAFFMGMLIAFAYETTGKFYVAVGVHMLANLCAYSMTYTGVFGGSLLNWGACLIALAVGAAGLWMVWKNSQETEKELG